MVMIIAYNSVNKATPWEVAGPMGRWQILLLYHLRLPDKCKLPKGSTINHVGGRGRGTGKVFPENQSVSEQKKKKKKRD